MRGISGGTSRVTLISLGDNTGNGTGSTNVATGTMDLTGGIADIMVSTIVMGTTTASGTGVSHGARGTLTFTGGTIDATSIILGNLTQDMNTQRDTTGDSGTFNVNGTANLIVGTGGITMGVLPAGGTTIGRSAGTLNIRNTATVTMGGDIKVGGLPAVVSNNAVGSYSTLSMSGGTLNMNGHNIGSVSAPLNTFTANGGSITNLGRLTASTFRVNNNYSLTAGPVTIANGGSIDMRNTAGNTLTVNNLTLPATANLYFELSSNNLSGNDQIGVGSLTFGGGTTTVKVSPLSSSFSASTYHLINYSGKTGSTTWAISNTTRNVMSDPVDTGSSIDLTITPAAAHDLTWSATGGTGTWDWNTTANWTSSSGADKYFDLDTVNFNTQAAASTVTLSNTFPGATAAGIGFYPGAVTINSTSDYTFTGASAGNDKISGSTGLYKDGSGVLTVSMVNDYTGTTTIHAGTIKLGIAGALGNNSSALVIDNGGTLELNRLTLGNKPITIQGAGVGNNGAIINTSTSAPMLRRVTLRTSR